MSYISRANIKKIPDHLQFKTKLSQAFACGAACKRVKWRFSSQKVVLRIASTSQERAYFPSFIGFVYKFFSLKLSAGFNFQMKV